MSTPVIYLDITQVCQATSLSRTAWLELVTKGDAPKPRALTKQRSGWLLREVTEWCESRPVADRAPPPNTGHSNRPHAKRNRVIEGAPA
mgnify:CR=1 FL=1